MSSFKWTHLFSVSNLSILFHSLLTSASCSCSNVFSNSTYNNTVFGLVQMFLNINTLTLAASDYVNIRGSLRRIKRSSLTVSTDSLPIFSHIHLVVTPLDSGRDAQHLLYFMNDPCILQQKLIDRLLKSLWLGCILAMMPIVYFIILY